MDGDRRRPAVAYRTGHHRVELLEVDAGANPLEDLARLASGAVTFCRAQD